MTNRPALKIKTTSSDLQGAVVAAYAHFREVGLTRETARTFILNCREAGLKVTTSADKLTLILSH